MMNSERILEAMREPVRKFVERVRTLAGENGLAMTGFGAIAMHGFDPARHVVRSVLVLEQIDLAMLRELAKDGAKQGKAKIAAPLIMTPAYIHASLDTFPLEFLEMRQCHVCFAGADYFADLSLRDTHLRLQCERELKTMLIGMRQGLLAAAGREKLFGAMEGDIVERLMRTLRGLLWLHGQHAAPPASDATTATDDANEHAALSSLDVVTRIEQEIDRPLPGVRGALQETRRHTWDDFTRLYHEIDGLNTLADRW